MYAGEVTPSLCQWRKVYGAGLKNHKGIPLEGAYSCGDDLRVLDQYRCMAPISGSGVLYGFDVMLMVYIGTGSEEDLWTSPYDGQVRPIHHRWKEKGTIEQRCTAPGWYTSVGYCFHAQTPDQACRNEVLTHPNGSLTDETPMDNDRIQDWEHLVETGKYFRLPINDASWIAPL